VADKYHDSEECFLNAEGTLEYKRLAEDGPFGPAYEVSAVKKSKAKKAKKSTK
jgi:hypothetical protein